MAILWLVFALGVVCIAAGFVAAIDSQPVAVCSPLLLDGILAMTLTSIAHVKLRRLYREIELRKIQAMDT
jgi:hypothetical protein